ncbi:MAG: flagellar hook-length control protein FliK, partial [Solimonas sp.]
KAASARQPRTEADPAASADFAALLGGAAAATDAAAMAANDEAADNSGAADDPAGDDPAASDGAGKADAGPGGWLALLRQSLALNGTSPADDASAAAASGVTGGKPATKPLAAAMPAAPTTDPPEALAALADGAPAAAVLPVDDDTAPGFGDLLTLAGDAPQPTVDTAVATGQTAMMSVATGDTATKAPAAGTAAAPPPMTVPPDHPQFVDGLGERIVWIADRGLDQARIELHPVELGSLTVQLSVRGDEAQVSFTAERPATRALLQNSLPQLRELMSAQGLQLLRTQIEQRVGAARGSDASFDASRDGRDAPGELAGAAPLRRISRLKLVDAYV